MLRVELLLVSLTGLPPVNLVFLWQGGDVGEQQRECPGITGTEQGTVHPWGNKLDKRAVPGRDHRGARGHRLHDD